MEIVVREFDEERDRWGAEAVDRMCEVGPSGKMSLFTDLLGDPVCRVRHSPAFLMLVAETIIDGEHVIIGLIRGCVKTVTCGRSGTGPIYTMVGYILGLRVSPSHRRLGIGCKLVQRTEQWFIEQGAEYAYMATDRDNEASVQLFTGRCGYSKFRTPSILVQPVFAHRIPIPRRCRLLRLHHSAAERLYRRKFATLEFFPRDIDAVLRNPLSLGTFLAVPDTFNFQSIDAFLDDPSESWAVASIWDCQSVFRLEVRGASRLRRGLAWVSRAADRALQWLRIPSVPDLFRSFGLYFMYGIGGEGEEAVAMVKALSKHAHNLARDGGCGVVAAEVASCEPLREGIPHWRRLSCVEDLWCVKRLVGGGGGGDGYSDDDDWSKSVPGRSIFVDPREF